MRALIQKQVNAKEVMKGLDGLSHLLRRNDVAETLLLKHFRAHPSLILLLGRIYAEVTQPSLFAWELEISRYFRADFAVGQKTPGRYLVIEFESGGNCVFKRNGRSYRDWHPRLSHGYDQLGDWLWKFNEEGYGLEMRDVFPNLEYLDALLVIGRDRFINETEKRRLLFKNNQWTVKGRSIRIVTFDELLRDLQGEVEMAQSMSRIGTRAFGKHRHRSL